MLFRGERNALEIHRDKDVVHRDGYEIVRHFVEGNEAGLRFAAIQREGDGLPGIAGGEDIVLRFLVQQYAIKGQVEGRFATVAVNLQVQFAVLAFREMDASLRGDGDAFHFGGDGDKTGLAAGKYG